MKKIKDERKIMSREHEFWELGTEAENIALLTRIARLKRQGIDIDGLFDRVLDAHESSI